jgi:LPS sulfotransferase NodH
MASNRVITIPKWPVVIFASPRTGSTVLGEYLSNIHNTLYYNEPNLHPEEMKKFLNNFTLENNFVLKIMAEMIRNRQYPAYIMEKMLSNNCFKIKLTRKNVVEQIASFYTCRNRKIWGYDENNYKNWNNTNIDIDYPEIKYSIRWVTYQNKLLDHIVADISLSYEDLPTMESRSKKTPRPANYNELIDIISNFNTTIDNNINILC